VEEYQIAIYSSEKKYIKIAKNSNYPIKWLPGGYL
jgi:hypothetical protein